VALSLMKRLEQVALLDAHQIARLLLDVPDLHVREYLQCGAVAIFQAPGPAGDTTHPARGTTQEAHQAVGLAQWERLQNDGFRFPGGHSWSARRRCVELLLRIVRTARSRRTYLLTIRALAAQCFADENRRGSRAYVGILKTKYNPAKKNMMSGDQPARSGGNCPTLPIAASNSAPSQYTIPMPTPMATPPTAPRVPTKNAKGNA